MGPERDDVRERVDREPRKLRRQQRDERLPVRLLVGHDSELLDSIQVGIGKSPDALRERRAGTQKDRPLCAPTKRDVEPSGISMSSKLMAF